MAHPAVAVPEIKNNVAMAFAADMLRTDAHIFSCEYCAHHREVFFAHGDSGFVGQLEHITAAEDLHLIIFSQRRMAVHLGEKNFEGLVDIPAAAFRRIVVAPGRQQAMAHAADSSRRVPDADRDARTQKRLDTIRIVAPEEFSGLQINIRHPGGLVM